MPDAPDSSVSLTAAMALYSTTVHLARATLALGEARDCAILAELDPSGVASIDVALKICEGLTREAGEGLTTLRHSPDEDVRQYIGLLLDRLHPGWREADTRASQSTPSVEEERTP